MSTNDLLEKKLKRKKTHKPRSKIKITYTTGDPELNIKHFNKMMGTDFNNPSTEEAKEAAKGANADMGIESNGSSGNADIGEIIGGTNDAGTDCSGGEGMGESLNLREAKREVRRYYIRPQHIFCANKSEVIKALIDIGEENCSVYTLKNLGDEKDVKRLTTKDIIYFYDDGILYDKNHVRIMDYDLYIKHEEERKKFPGDINKVPEAEFKAEYEDRITHKTEFEESFEADTLKPLTAMINDLKPHHSWNRLWIAEIPVCDDYVTKVIIELYWDKYIKKYVTATSDATYLDDDGGDKFWEPDEEEAPNYDKILDILNKTYDNLTDLVNALRQADKLANAWEIEGITWYYNIYDEIPESTEQEDILNDNFNSEQVYTKINEDYTYSISVADFLNQLYNSPISLEIDSDNEDVNELGHPMELIYELELPELSESPNVIAELIAYPWDAIEEEANYDDTDLLAEYHTILEILEDALHYNWKIDGQNINTSELNKWITTLNNNPALNKRLTNKILDNDHFGERFNGTDLEEHFSKDIDSEDSYNLVEKLNPFEQDFPSINALGEELDHEKHTCCICGEEFEGYGNNPYPIRDEGVCCDACNLKFVIPARLENINNN